MPVRYGRSVLRAINKHRNQCGAKQLHAVVADDDPFARRAIIEALRRDGIEVEAEAHNGDEAVRLLPAAPARTSC